MQTFKCQLSGTPKDVLVKFVFPVIHAKHKKAIPNTVEMNVSEI